MSLPSNKRLSILSGVLMGLAFPPWNLHFLIWIAWIPLLAAVAEPNGARHAFIAGFVFFAMQLSWMPILWEWAGWSIYLGWLLLTLYLAVSFLIWGFLYFRFSPKPLYPRALFGAALYTLIEQIRGMGIFGVPVGHLGIPATQWNLFAQIAAYVGSSGLTFLILFFNILFAELFMEWQRKKTGIKKFVPQLLPGLAILLVILSVGLTDKIHILSELQENKSFLPIGLVQANIPQQLKMNMAARDEIFAKHIRVTKGLLEKNGGLSAVIWPETSILAFLTREPHLMSQLKELAQKHRVSFILGTPELITSKGQVDVFNSLLVLNTQGDVVGHYNKEQLVPFGEFLPFRPLLFPFFKNFSFFQQDFSRGIWEGPLHFSGVELAPAICFESTFSHLVRRHREAGPSLLVVITNDAWFHKTGIVTDHFRFGQLRAIELRTPLVQVANTGFTGYINPVGQIIQQSSLEAEAALVADIPISNLNSFYRVLGFGLFPIFLMLVVVVLGTREYT